MLNFLDFFCLEGYTEKQKYSRGVYTVRLNENFVIREMAGITVLLPLTGDFQGIMAVNPVGARILELLRDGVTEERLLFQALCREYDAPEEEIIQDACTFLAELRDNGILKEES